MLVLKRRIGEVVWVGAVRVTVLAGPTRGVALGFDGPGSVRIVREELGAGVGRDGPAGVRASRRTAGKRPRD